MLNHRNIKPRISVFGVGGAGGNAVNNMIAANITEIEFIAANTDMQALSSSRAHHKIQLGGTLTEGMGAGARPEVGEAAAEAAIEEIGARMFGAHMVFIAAGMGGGTGTGAAHVIARVAKDMGVLAVAVVTKPFHFEGTIRMRNADAGIAALRQHVDTLLVIPNENLFRVSTRTTTIAEAFVTADETLYSGLACIIDLIVKDGLIDLDFADVKTVLAGMGTSMMGMGEAVGESRAVLAAEGAIFNPLIDDVSLKGAKHLLLSITSGRDLTLWEVDEAANRVRQEIDPNANIIVGATLDESLGERMRVAIVASGMPRALDRLAIAAEPAAGRAQKALPAPVVENFGRRLADAIGERDPQGKPRGRRKSAERRAAASAATDAIAAAIAPDDDASDAPVTDPASTAPARRSGPTRKSAVTAEGQTAPDRPAERARRSPARGRRRESDDAASVGRRDYWAAQTGEAGDASPLALPPPQNTTTPARLDAPDEPRREAAREPAQYTAPSTTGAQAASAAARSLARLETAPDVERSSPRANAGARDDADGFRFLAQRMRLSESDLEDSGEATPGTHPPPAERLPAPGSLVAFRREPPSPPREVNLLQRLAGLMRGRREA